MTISAIQISDTNGWIVSETEGEGETLSVVWRKKVFCRADANTEVAAIELATIVPDPVDPSPNVSDVKKEAQRRIIALTGATTFDGAIVKQMNASMRATELNDIRHDRVLTAEEQVEADALRALASAIKSIRAKSNEIEAMDPIPDDYATNETYWSA
jgi:hypothetical protein